MHPQSVYDVVVLEHQRATRVRVREHELRLRRRERLTGTVRGRRAARVASAVPRPAAA